MAEKFNVTGEQYFVIDNLLIDLKRLIANKGGCLFRPIWISWALQDIIENRFVNVCFDEPAVISKKTRYPVTDGIFFKIDGQMLDLKRQLRCFRKSGSPLNPLLIIKALENLKAGRFSFVNRPLLQLLPEKSFYSKTPSKLSISEADSIFTFGIDNNFSKNSSVSSGLTNYRHPSFYNLNYNSTLKQIFNFFKDKEISQLCFDEGQVVDLCSCYHIYDTKGCFLIPFFSPEGPAVAAVYSNPGNLSVIRHSVDDQTLWHSDEKIFVVIAQ